MQYFILLGKIKKLSFRKKLNADLFDNYCPFFGDKIDNNISALPDNGHIWTPFERFNVVLLSRNGRKDPEIAHKSSKCHLSKLYLLKDFRPS